MRRTDLRPAPSGFSTTALAEGRALFQRRTTRELTEEDAREIAHNVAGVFTLLMEWKREKLAREAADRGGDAA